MMKIKELMKKMCVIGEAAVGKTSLIRRFVYDRFSDRYIATIGTKTSAKELKITTEKEDVNLQLQIWDIIGLRSFAKLQKHAYKGAKGAFFVMDITRKGTLRTFEGWLLSLYRVAGEIPVVLLANKVDLKADFRKEEIEESVKDYGFPYFFTSAKTGKNVNEAFETLGELMIKPWQKKKIIPQLEESQTMLKEVEPELESGRSLSVFEVENIIMARYCDLLENPDFAMGIINEQYRKAGLDFMDPTIERLNTVVEFLIKAAEGHVEPPRLEKEKNAYMNLVKKVG
jgi:small GTP-binding protein